MVGFSGVTGSLVNVKTLFENGYWNMIQIKCLCLVKVLWRNDVTEWLFKCDGMMYRQYHAFCDGMISVTEWLHTQHNKANIHFYHTFTYKFIYVCAIYSSSIIFFIKLVSKLIIDSLIHLYCIKILEFNIILGTKFIFTFVPYLNNSSSEGQFLINLANCRIKILNTNQCNHLIVKTLLF